MTGGGGGCLSGGTEVSRARALAHRCVTLSATTRAPSSSRAQQPTSVARTPSAPSAPAAPPGASASATRPKSRHGAANAPRRSVEEERRREDIGEGVGAEVDVARRHHDRVGRLRRARKTEPRARDGRERGERKARAREKAHRPLSAHASNPERASDDASPRRLGGGSRATLSRENPSEREAALARLLLDPSGRQAHDEQHADRVGEHDAEGAEEQPAVVVAARMRGAASARPRAAAGSAVGWSRREQRGQTSTPTTSRGAPCRRCWRTARSCRRRRTPRPA